MRIILTDNIKRLGQIGDIKEVRPGYALNFLLPHKRAIAATKQNLKQLNMLLKKREAQELIAKQNAYQTAEKLKELVVPISVKTTKKGTLYETVAHSVIAQELQKLNVTIDAEQIVVPEPIKKIGEWQVFFQYQNEIKQPFKLIVQSRD